MHSQIASQDIRASVWFLKESELYTTVKPYTLGFTPAVNLPRSNIEREEVPIRISDLRGVEAPFSLDDNGFEILKLQDTNHDVDWDNYEMVRDVHGSFITAEVERIFPQAQCCYLDHKVRRRHPSFPNSTGKDYANGQPLRGAHIDMVHSSAEQMVQERCGDQTSSIMKGRYLVANVWHPLRGPNQDWPLALCDTSTVDPERDLEVSDYLTPTTSREHCLVYARESHRWWYMSNQGTTDAFLFRQYDPQKGEKSGVPHASFLNPNTQGDKPRASVEVCVIIYWP